jgi:hypothetical protein
VRSPSDVPGVLIRVVQVLKPADKVQPLYGGGGGRAKTPPR